MDGVRVLPVAGDEAVDRERVEGPERERVAVDEQERRLFRVRHALSLAAASDSPGGPRRDPVPARSAPRSARPIRERRRRSAEEDGDRVRRARRGLLGGADARRGQHPGHRHPARRCPRRARRVARLAVVGDPRRPRSRRGRHRDQRDAQPVGRLGLGDRNLPGDLARAHPVHPRDRHHRRGGQPPLDRADDELPRRRSGSGATSSARAAR